MVTVSFENLSSSSLSAVSKTPETDFFFNYLVRDKGPHIKAHIDEYEHVGRLMPCKLNGDST